MNPLNRKPVWAILVILSIAVTVFISGFSLAAWGGKKGDLPMKSMMGDNFQKVQVILMDLVTSNYIGLSGEIESIREHAIELSKKGLKSKIGKSNPRLFTNYAYTLERQAGNMATVLTELIRHDQIQSTPGELNIDYLRVVAARHFGEMVTTCVLCHNQFRRKVVK